jgi:hypothetical protein
MYVIQLNNGDFYGAETTADGSFVPRLFPTIRGALVARTRLGLNGEIMVALVKARALPKALAPVNG